MIPRPECRLHRSKPGASSHSSSSSCTAAVQATAIVKIGLILFFSTQNWCRSSRPLPSSAAPFIGPAGRWMCVDGRRLLRHIVRLRTAAPFRTLDCRIIEHGRERSSMDGRWAQEKEDSVRLLITSTAKHLVNFRLIRSL